MSQKKTPLLQQPRNQSGTVYVFPSASEDIGLNVSSDVNGVALTHYALLNIPDIAFDKLCFNKDTELYDTEKANEQINPNQLLAMSLQNYAMNFETVLLNQESYNYQNTATVSERVFWHWMKEIGALNPEKYTEIKVDNSKNYYYCLDGKDRLIQCFGSIDSGNKVHSEFGMYNETYINVPSSYGAGPVFFTQVFDENYKPGSYVGDSVLYLEGRSDQTDYISYSNNHDHPYFDITNKVNQNKYIISEPEADNLNTQFDGLEVVKDLDTLSTIISEIIPEESKPFMAVSYDEINVDARNVLYDKNIDNKVDGKLVKTTFNFNAILLYYSIYDQTDRVSRVHATNLFGIIFLDGPIVINGNSSSERYMSIPTIQKRKSTSTSFGTGYSFRVNIKTLSIYDDSNSVIQDNTTVASTSANDFNGAIQAMNRAIDIMNTNMVTTSKIQDSYAKIINIYDEQRKDITDISTMLHDYVEGRTNPILSVGSLYTDAIYTQMGSEDGIISFYTPGIGTEGYNRESNDAYESHVKITPTGMYSENTFGTNQFQKQYFVLKDFHTGDYPLSTDVNDLKQTQFDTALANKIIETRDLINDMFTNEALQVKLRSVTEMQSYPVNSEGDDDVWERYKFDLYINPDSSVFNNDFGISHLKTMYNPDISTNFPTIDYVGLIPYIVAGLQDANQYTYTPLSDDIKSIGDVTKTKDAISYLVQRIAGLQEISDNGSNVDLSDYVTKSDLAEFNSNNGDSSAGIINGINYGDIKSGEIIIPLVGKNTPGLMSIADKQKLDGLNLSDILGGLASYGYTTAATPPISKDETFESYKEKNPKPVGTPISLADKAKASATMPYIWMRANNYEEWEIVDAFYVTVGTVIQSKLGEAKITPLLGYGSVVIDTDLTWAMFPANKGGSGWSTTKSDALLFYPAVVVDPSKIGEVSTGLGETSYMSTGSVNTQFALTLERWDRNSTSVPVLTNKMALQQIFNMISTPTAEFDWNTFSTYYTGSTPFSPIVIKFTNGVFTIQDMHSLSVDENTNQLKSVSLFGSLTVYNTMNAYLQGSHGQLNKYRVDTGLRINLGPSCSMELGSNYSNSYAVVTLLPQAG